MVETVGEATWERSLAAAPEGRIVVCGATTGHSPPARLYRLWWKQLTVYGSTMGMPADFEAAYELDQKGRARVHVDSVFPLAEAAKAHERLESGAQFGKVVLRSRGNADAIVTHRSGREADAFRDPRALEICASGYRTMRQQISRSRG